MVKASKKSSTAAAYAAWLLREAKLGNTMPLAGYLDSGGPLTAELRKFVVELLERSEGKRGKAELRQLEKRLTKLHVENLKSEGWKPEAAVHEVARERGHSRAYVYAALEESKKPK